MEFLSDGAHNGVGKVLCKQQAGEEGTHDARECIQHTEDRERRDSELETGSNFKEEVMLELSLQIQRVFQ